MGLAILKIEDLSLDEKKRVDNFILDQDTNGEFINTIKYLDYHSANRFKDESIIIKKTDSGVIKCVMMAATNIEFPNILISHPGTTFSGLIIKYKTSIAELDIIISLIENYYSSKYDRIILKFSPTLYNYQPNEELYYLLVKKKFIFGYNALVNIIDLSKYKDDHTIFENYHSARRYEIKKSIKLDDLQFKSYDYIDESIWENMNQNLKERYNSKTTHSYSEISYLKSIFPNNIEVYVSSTKNGLYGAFALVYKFKNVFHTQYLDMNYNISYLNPNLFLIHNLIKLAVNEGYKYFSFGASTENGGEYLNENLYKYKINFGGGGVILPKFIKEI
jgi:hypothetical protein